MWLAPCIGVALDQSDSVPGKDGRQFLAYSMIVNAEKELAMVLPLPVKVGATEEAVSFIDLSGYPDFFADLLKGFPAPTQRATESC